MPPGRIGLLGWLLVAARISGWVLLMIAMLPCLAIWQIFTVRRVWPQIYFKGFCAIMGLSIQRHGKPGRNTLFLPNHTSWMDTPALLAATGTAFVANDSLANNRPLKFLCDLNETIFIARHRRSTIGSQVEEVRAAIRDAGALTIYIEGTTTRGDRLLPFKSALLAAIEPLPEGLTVQPVWLHYPEGANVSWFGTEPGLANVKRMLGRLRPIRLDIHFLAPLQGAQLADRKTMAAAAQAAIAGAMAQAAKPA